MTVLRDYAAAMTRPTLSLDSPADPRYDEVVAPDGALRPAWKGLAEIALPLTPDELHRFDGEDSFAAQMRRASLRHLAESSGVVRSLHPHNRGRRGVV